MKNKIPKYGISFPAISVAIVSLLVFMFASGRAGWSQSAQGKEQQLKNKQLIQTIKIAVPAEGQKAAVDPDTKQLRELTPEESKALSKDFKKSAGAKGGEVRVYKFDGGTLAAELPEEYMDSIVVRRNPDGSLSTECVSGLKNEKAVLSQPEKQAPKPKLEEE